jgi:enediyne biosynthesis protein E4
VNRRSFLLALSGAGVKPLTFEDVSRRAGLTAATVFGGRTQNRYILETTGCGAAFFDYDHDGWPDIFLVNGTTLEGTESPRPSNRLLHNNRDGTFRDVTAEAGLVKSGWGQGVCIGDYDNDGRDDLFVTYWGHNVLYHNNGDGTFTDVTQKAGLYPEKPGWGTGCAFLDFDGDGHLDLFVTSYIEFDLKTAPSPGSGDCRYQGLPVNCGPRGLPKARNYLFRNNGDGTFSDVTAKSGIGNAAPSYGLGVLVSDFNNDGRPDIYVANDSDPSYLFWNNGDGTFTEGGMAAGVASNSDGRFQSGMGVAAADYDGDGRIDIFKTNFSDDLPNLYRNTGKGLFEEETLAAGLGVNSRFLGWGCGFLDADNDGWPDIFYVNGHVYPEIDRLPGQGYRQPKVLFLNQGNGTFRDISQAAGPAVGVKTAARGCAFADFDNDGSIDILINPINDVPQLLKCKAPGDANWVTLKLVGTKSNRSAVGARVRCVTGKHEQVDEVRSGGSYMSQNDLRIHFGLGKAERADLVEIRWPSGLVERFADVPVNRFLTIREGEGKWG